MHRRSILGALLAMFAPLACIAADDTLIRQGAYIYRAGGCAGCHTDEKGKGGENAGGRAIESPFGTFYAPNITPDREHGIGKWSEADFMRSLRDGIAPNGHHYYPAFPYTSYTRLYDDDVRALWAYLRSRPAVARPNTPHELVWYANRTAVRGWKALYFEPGRFTPDPARSERVNRGAYLATAAAHCEECHTPRDHFGGLKKNLQYAGTRDGPDGGVVPNITPDKRTGIGRWNESDLAYYLETGLTPDGDSAGDLMAEVIDNGLQYLTKDDLRSIAAFIFSLPPIEHQVSKPREKDKYD